MKLKKCKELIKWLLISGLGAAIVCYLSISHLCLMDVADQKDFAKVIISLFGTFFGFSFCLAGDYRQPVFNHTYQKYDDYRAL
ncbi:hypothetical protein [Moraxella sp. Pampa]|uniref:hypothetical protein n=1 Tax=Moraxella sp. Pampa TaxID=3111978 RepID=UPI002B40E4E8|nr:hypothetical protein [Moraxella sp. Pampa]